MSDFLTLRYESNTAIITLNNPPANTWTLEGLQLLSAFIDDIRSQPEVMVIVLQSDNGKFFSAGADLKCFSDVSAEEARPMTEAFSKAFEALTDFRGVTIAAINGYAMGGGLEVALACDFRIAETGAVMALPEARVGLLPCAGGTQNLTSLVGEPWAKRIILCGERVDAEKALHIGLVDEVVSNGQSQQVAMALANKVGRQSPDSVVACKKLIQMPRENRASALKAERVLFLELFDKDNQREGVNAFLEKRDPQWRYSH